MDRMNFNSYDHFHYYNQTYQEGGQHTYQPETGQTFGGGAASGASWNYPGQPYQDFNVQAQIPFSPGLDWESALRTPQPMAMEDLIHGQIYQQDSQYSSHETGQASAGGPASEPWWSQPTPGQPQPYQNFNFPEHIPPLPGSDWEYLQQAPQSSALENTIGSEMSLSPSDAQSAVQNFSFPDYIPPLPRSDWEYLQQSPQPNALENIIGNEVSLSPSDAQPAVQNFNFPDYIPSLPRSDWEYLQQSPQPNALENIIGNEVSLSPSNAQPAVEAPQRNQPIKERFLASLEAYAQGLPLKHCASSFRLANYIKDDGSMAQNGPGLYKQLTDDEKMLLEQAIIARQAAKLPTHKAPVEERFLAGLDNYARGVPLKNCSATLKFKIYATDSGYLHSDGDELRARLSSADQKRVDDALLSRRQFYLNRAMKTPTVEERFLAGLDSYAQGVLLSDCSRTVQFGSYVTDKGRLFERGEALYKNLLPEDQNRVSQALAARRRWAAERISGDLPHFLAALEPYSYGMDLKECGKQAGLTMEVERYQKVGKYLTPEGGLTPDGELLIENLSPDQQNDVWDKVRQRRQHMDPSAQLPEIPASMPEMEGMDSTAMVDPMQTEAMWATVWQLTGQAMPRTRGIPSESVEPLIPSYNNEAFGADFQHYYGPYANQYSGGGV